MTLSVRVMKALQERDEVTASSGVPTANVSGKLLLINMFHLESVSGSVSSSVRSGFVIGFGFGFGSGSGLFCFDMFGLLLLGFGSVFEFGTG